PNNLIYHGLKLPSTHRAEAEKKSDKRAKNQQRDDVCATHSASGLQIVNCGLCNPPRLIAAFNPQSKIRNPQWILPPLAICRGHLTQKFKFIEAFASPFRHRTERIFSDMDRQTCFLAQELVKAA